MDRKEVSEILLKARETIESCDKTINEVREVHRRSAEELRRMSDVLSFGHFRFSVDPIPMDKKDVGHGVSKISLGQEPPVQEEIKEKNKSLKSKMLAAMLKRNSTATYDLSSLTYSTERIKKDEMFKREDAKIKPSPLILVDKNHETIGNAAATKAQERRQSFGKSNMSRIQKTR